MKKIIGLCFMLFILQHTILSQNEFGAVGSYWRYSFESHSGDGGGWTMVKIEKDTIIADAPYKKYSLQHYYKPMIEPAIEYTTTGLIQLQNDTIFSAEKPILDFNMGLTDSLYLQVDEGIDIQLVVDSITIEKIGAFDYKKWHGQKICVNGSNQIGPYEPFTILETVGQIARGFLFWNIDGCSIGGGLNKFVCYKNGAFTYPPGADCEFLVSTGLDDLSTTIGLDLFPNPVSDFLTIKLTDRIIDEVHLITITGKEIFHNIGASQQVELDMSTVKKGMYFIKVKSENSVIIRKILKS